MPTKYQLTPVELELMEILWHLGEGTVHEVMAELPSQRQLAYTSVSTILRILQQKNVLTTKKRQRQHIYRPLLSKEVFANHTIKKIVRQIFSGNPGQFVSFLVDKNQLSLDEIKHIEALLAEKKKELSSHDND